MLMTLPRATGLHELGLVLTMTRAKGESPHQWAQRVGQGRTAVGQKLGGNNLSDTCYVELLLRGLHNREKGEMVKERLAFPALVVVVGSFDGDLRIQENRAK